VPNDDPRERYAADADLLREIGAVLALQPTRILVHLPANLAERAEAAWHRDESGEPGVGSTEERENRSHAADVALIGLAVRQSGIRTADHVAVELGAIEVGAALVAHFER
jgi:hypothetical protein